MGTHIPETAIEAENKPLVVWYTAVSNLAGVGRHFLDMAKEGGVPGYRLVIVAPEGKLASMLRDAGMAVVTGPFGAREQNPLVAMWAFRRLLRELRPAIVHTHLPYADIVGAVARRGLKGPHGAPMKLISTEHCIAEDHRLLQPNDVRAAIMLRVHHVRLRFTDHLIGVAAYTEKQVRRQWSRTVPLTVVRNGADRIKVERDNSPGLRVLSMARLEHEKRIDKVIDVWAEVAKRHPEAHLDIAGEGSMRPQLEQYVRDRKLEDRITFIGFVDKEKAYVNHDVMVQLSAVENLSYALLEAVSYGIGVIATDVGGNDEILPPHCIVDIERTVEAAEAIVHQGMHPESRPTLPDHIPTVREMLEGISAVYRKVLE